MDIQTKSAEVLLQEASSRFLLKVAGSVVALSEGAIGFDDLESTLDEATEELRAAWDTDTDVTNEEEPNSEVPGEGEEV